MHETRRFYDNSFIRDGMVGGVHRLYMADPQLVSVIADGGISVEPMSQPQRIERGEYGYSLGANPCIIIVVVSKNHVMHLAHLIDTIPDSFLETVRTAIGGIAGGNRRTLTRYKELFERGKIIQKISDDPHADFNVAVIRRTDLSYEGLRIPQGLIYGYGRC